MPNVDSWICVLQTLYKFCHLNVTKLSDIHVTPLIQHHLHLVPGTKPYAVTRQRRLAPHKQRWIQKLVEEGLQCEIYEQTVTANGRLSP